MSTAGQTQIISAPAGWYIIVPGLPEGMRLPDATEDSFELSLLPIIGWNASLEPERRSVMAITMVGEMDLSYTVLRTPSGAYCEWNETEFDEVSARRRILFYGQQKLLTITRGDWSE